MSKKSEIFEKAEVLSPNRSGYNLDFENLFTTNCGTLTPCLVQNVIPNTNVDLTTNFVATLPPLATDFFGRVDVCIEAFFVPYRICYGGWDEFISQTVARHLPVNNSVSFGLDSGSSNPVDTAGTLDEDSYIHTISGIFNVASAAGGSNNTFTVPVNDRLPNGSVSVSGPGSLADYLGFKNSTGAMNQTVSNLLPFVAYHKIYDSYYRNTLKQKPVFVNPVGDSTITNTNYAMYLPYIRFGKSGTATVPNNILNDGVRLDELRQRRYSNDYFTSATPTCNPACSDSEGMYLQTPTTDGEMGGISINQLRVANTLQMWMDRQNVTGWRYRDNIYSRFGVMPHTCCNDPIFLGSSRTPLYNNSVSTTAQSSQYTFDDAGQYVKRINTSEQPWKGAGQSIAKPTTAGNNKLIDNYLVREHGVIMCLFSLVPHAYYGTGVNKYCQYMYATDFADALLQNAGNQAIYNTELIEDAGVGDNYNKVFGWTIPYAEQCYHNDEVHGLFRSGESLSNFALKREFKYNDDPQANAAFETIGIDALDEVCAADAKVSKYGVQVDMAHNLRIVQPLARFVVPTLGTPDFMGRKIVSRGGSKL